MSDEIPYYERTLDSFADHIITRTRPYDGGFHAVLDCGFDSSLSDPDFSPHGYGKTREEAAKKSATAIRNNARGIGKFAPRALLLPGYDLHFRLMKHWMMKERFEKVGLDPNEMYLIADQANNEGGWELQGQHLNVYKEKRILEFAFRLHLAEVSAEFRAGNISEDYVHAEVKLRVEADLNDARRRSRPTEATWDYLNHRISEHLVENELNTAPAIR